ncbi:pyruvate kinase [Pendulispora brunnea]|uniref:Pyruvate kinase n=1 Tax=Pendulispora brunnea TaxID=2905690 RepID=A0ABZ2KEG6_9BACT
MTMRRAKLVCTLGPACDSLEGLGDLIDAGMDVARFNFSHGSHEEHGARIARLREVSQQKKKSVAILQDLCGPKVRTGKFPAPYDLPTGSEVVLYEGDESQNGMFIPIQYEGLAGDVRQDDRILFDDGRLGLTVLRIEGDKVHARVDQGGGMRNHVGVHLPSRTMRVSPLTEKDKEDLAFGLTQGIDYIALSFVRRAEDLRLVRDIATAWGQPTPIIAKIETPDAVDNLESVVAASDGVMVARGDLGVEFPPERVPVIQRQILSVARRVRRPVIVATEMLQSMTKSPRPTRAEASDVANAVYSGTDAVMLSGETANGQFPTLSASMMSRIALEAEKSPFFDTGAPTFASRATSVAEAIARGACNTAREIGAKYLVAFTESGLSAMNVSLARPHVPIIAFSTNARTRRRMALYWGVIPREMPAMHDMDQLVDWCTGDLMAGGLASPGERVVIVFGAPIGVSGSTNTIRVHVIG